MKKLGVFLTVLSLWLIIQSDSVYPQNSSLTQTAAENKSLTEPAKVVLEYWNLTQLKTSDALTKLVSLITSTPGDYSMNGDICHPDQPNYSKNQQFYVILTGKRGVESFIVQDNKDSAHGFYTSIKNKKLRFSKILTVKEKEDEAAVQVEYNTPESAATISFLLTKRKDGWKIFAITQNYDSQNKYFAEKIECLGDGAESNNSPAKVVKDFWDISFETSGKKESIRDLMLPARSVRPIGEDDCTFSSPNLEFGRNSAQRFSENIRHYKFYETREGIIEKNKAAVRLSYLRNKNLISHEIYFLLYKLDGQWKIFSITTDTSIEKKYFTGFSCR